jgi:hypothetical protein
MVLALGVGGWLRQQRVDCWMKGVDRAFGLGVVAPRAKNPGRRLVRMWKPAGGLRVWDLVEGL